MRSLINNSRRSTIFDLCVMALGACIYAFALVNINIENDLSEGGLAGISLILRAVFHINPAYSFTIINIPLILLAYRYLGRRSLFYAIYGVVILSVFLDIWQRIPIYINISHDLLIASLFAGLGAGVGLGLIYRVGGSTDGTEVVARIIKKYTEIGMPTILFVFDIIVMCTSLVYINLTHLAYTLIASFVFMMVSQGIVNGGYTVRGVLVISDHSKEIADRIMKDFDRGVTYIDGKGAYTGNEKEIIYAILSPREVVEVKRLILKEIDSKAFISVLNVHEVVGEKFRLAE